MSDEKQEDQTERTLVYRLRKAYQAAKRRGVYRKGTWISVREEPRNGAQTTKIEVNADDL